MLASAVLLMIIGAVRIPLTADSIGQRDSAFAALERDSVPAVVASLAVQRLIAFQPLAPLDTPRVRRRAVQVSDWYSRRLTIHRYVAYATIPVFGLQWAAGDQLYKKSSAAPT